MAPGTSRLFGESRVGLKRTSPPSATAARKVVRSPGIARPEEPSPDPGAAHRPVPLAGLDGWRVALRVSSPGIPRPKHAFAQEAVSGGSFVGDRVEEFETPMGEDGHELGAVRAP